jgi:hypothetical protein
MGNQQKWTKVTATVETEDTGDILAQLRSVREQYASRAQKFIDAGKPGLAEYYQEQMANIDSLLTQAVFGESVARNAGLLEVLNG